MVAELRNTSRIAKVSHRSKRVGEVKEGCLGKLQGQDFKRQSLMI